MIFWHQPRVDSWRKCLRMNSFTNNSYTWNGTTDTNAQRYKHVYTSVQFSHSAISNCLWPHGLQHARLPWPSPTLRACSNSHPSSQWCHPTISSSIILFSSWLQFSQHQGLFQWVSSLHQVAKVWSFSFSISPFNEYSGLISFRMDWLDLFAVQGTLKSLLYHHSSKPVILQRSAFFMVQLSHPYMTTGKTIALTRQTCVSVYTYWKKKWGGAAFCLIVKHSSLLYCLMLWIRFFFFFILCPSRAFFAPFGSCQLTKFPSIVLFFFISCSPFIPSGFSTFRWLWKVA